VQGRGRSAPLAGRRRELAGAGLDRAAGAQRRRVVHRGTASCRIQAQGVDELYEELRSRDVLHPVSTDGVDETDFGTREFATLDQDGNLVTFFQCVSS